MNEPKLAAPGAGIPLFELLIAKYILFPLKFRNTTVAQALDELREERDKILALARSITPEQLVERRLIPRLPGLEDSSRYWSVAMTIEHLVIIGENTRGLLLALGRGKTNLPIGGGTAAVKPSKDVDPESIFARFEKMTDDLLRAGQSIDFDKIAAARHPHPWFGPLSAKQWLMFIAPHESLHRQQIEQIIAPIVICFDCCA